MGDEIVVVANFSRDSQTISVPFPGKKAWREIFTDQTREIDSKADLKLDAWSASIYVRA